MCDATIKDPKVKDVSNTIKARYDCGIENQKSVGCMVLEPVTIPITIKRLGNLYDENAGGARAGNVYAPNGLAPALQTAQGGNRQPLMYEDYRIRKLTPRECFRLMGFSDADFDKIKGISNTQLYKMAGNSIVVNVLEAIFKQLFKENHK